MLGLSKLIQVMQIVASMKPFRAYIVTVNIEPVIVYSIGNEYAYYIVLHIDDSDGRCSWEHDNTFKYRWGNGDQTMILFNGAWKQFRIEYSKLRSVAIRVCHYTLTWDYTLVSNIRIPKMPRGSIVHNGINTFLKMDFRIIADCDFTARPNVLYNGETRTRLVKVKLDEQLVYKCDASYHDCKYNGTRRVIKCKLDAKHLYGKRKHNDMSCLQRNCAKINEPGVTSYLAKDTTTVMQVACLKGKSLTAAPDFSIVQNVKCECNRRDTRNPEWNQTIQPCLEDVSCEPLAAITNGILLSGTNNYQSTRRIVQGEKLELQCDTGYLPVTSEMVCNLEPSHKKALWSSRPTCTKITCDAPNSPTGEQNGIMDALGKTTYAVGDKVVVKCNRGFTPAENNLECVLGNDGHSSTWEYTLCKVVTCIAQSVPPFGTLLSENGLTYISHSPAEHSTSLTVSCSYGYKPDISNNTTVSCILTSNSTAEWSDNIASCIEITCDSLAVPHNGFYNYTYDVGNGPVSIRVAPSNNATLICKVGSRLTGSNNIARCELDDAQKLATWKLNSDNCTEIHCHVPPTPLNGQFYMKNTPLDVSDTIRHSQQIVLICDYGHKLNGTGRTIECNLNDLYKNASWSSLGSSCKEIECPVPPAPVNGQLYINSIPLDASQTVPHSQQVVIICDNGYELNATGDTITCVLNNIYKNASWNSLGGACTEKLCKARPPTIVDTDTYVPGINISLHKNETYTTVCKRGFSGRNTVKCDVENRTDLIIGPRHQPCKKRYCNTSQFNITPSQLFEVDQVFTLSCIKHQISLPSINVTCLWNNDLELAHWNLNWTCSGIDQLDDSDSHKAGELALSWTIPLSIFTLFTFFFIMIFPLGRNLEREITPIPIELISETMDSPTLSYISEAMSEPTANSLGSTMTDNEVESESDETPSQNDIINMMADIQKSKTVKSPHMNSSIYVSAETRTSEIGKSVPTYVPSDIPEEERAKIDPRAYDKHSIASTRSRTHTPSLEEEKLEIIAEVLFDYKRPPRPEKHDEGEVKSMY